jgi:hypothetical protein
VGWRGASGPAGPDSGENSNGNFILNFEGIWQDFGEFYMEIKQEFGHEDFS